MSITIPPCDCCGAPIRSVAGHDAEVTGGDQNVAGAFLCDRESCIARHNFLDVESRRRLYRRLPASPEKRVTVDVRGASPKVAAAIYAAAKAAIETDDDDDIDGPAPGPLADLERLALAYLDEVMLRDESDPERRLVINKIRAMIGGTETDRMLAQIAAQRAAVN